MSAEHRRPNAGQDQDTSASDIQMLRAAVKKARVDSQIIGYPDAQYRFSADCCPSHTVADARDGWRRLRAWFNARGVRAACSWPPGRAAESLDSCRLSGGLCE